MVPQTRRGQLACFIKFAVVFVSCFKPLGSQNAPPPRESLKPSNLFPPLQPEAVCEGERENDFSATQAKRMFIPTSSFPGVEVGLWHYL